MHSAIGHESLPVIASAKDLVVREGDTEILHGVSLEVYQGENLIITGPSGSGKSTLIRALGGIQPPTTGTVELLGTDLYACSEEERGRRIREHVRNGFQAPKLDTNLTVREVLGDSAKMTGRYSIERMVRIAHTLGLAVGSGSDGRSMMDRWTGNLSGGEQARVNLGRVVIADTALILLDEPMSAVDTKGKEDLYGRLDQLRVNEGLTIVTVTHDGELAQQYATRQIEMLDGQIAHEIDLTYAQ